MAKINTNVSLDAETKAKAQELFAELGLDLSTAINLYLHQAVIENAIPFRITRQTPNAETVEAIKEVERMKADPSLGKGYTDIDTMFEDLLA